jgi:predicted metal-dependent phosphoesterase TrpH
VAITDHDTVAGVPEAMQTGREAGIEVVPGVEIGVAYTGEMHILGYYLDPGNRELAAGLALLRRYREERNPRLIRRLQELGFQVALEEVAQLAGGEVIGRPHFAALLVQKGYVADRREAFDRYLREGRLAYIKKDKLTPQQGIGLITKAGGIPVLAHPKYVRSGDRQNLAGLVEELMGYGLKGLEVFYSEHTRQETKIYYDLAVAKGLLMTGGTDFHGKNKPDIEIGRGRGDLAVNYHLLERLKLRDAPVFQS